MNREEYVKQVVKHLKCSAGKRAEIKKQLESDIACALEGGESMENIIARMGEPKALAGEFNENFPKEEIKAAGRKKAGIIIAAVAVIVVLLAVLLYWYLPKTGEIGAGRREELQKEAETVITLLDADDYDGLAGMSDSAMEQLFGGDAGSLRSAKEQIGSDWGEFVSYGNIYMTSIRQMGREYEVVQLSVSYEKVSVTYTITFDGDGKLAGLYMK